MPRSLLLICSDAEQSQTLSTLLQADGFDVRVASTGADAVSLMGKRLSRFVVIDDDPPDISACNLAVHLKALAQTLVPTWSCTTVALRGDILRGESVDGFDLALVKPVEISNLSKLLLVAAPPQVH